MQKVGLRWLSGECEGTIDLFSKEDLSQDVREKVIEHEVIWSDGIRYEDAKCLLTVAGRSVILDYEKFPETNKSRGFLLGVIRLTVSRSPEFRISRVEWKDEGESEFEDFDFEYVARRSKRYDLDAISKNFNSRLHNALSLSQDDLAEHLPPENLAPSKIRVTTSAFIRSPYVVAAALRRANGKCERCGCNAPFISRSTNQPYLEVHHVNPLSEGGADSLNNTLALCPNCHRTLHYG